MAATTPDDLLRDFLRQDAPARERSVAMWMMGVGAACLAMSIGLGPTVGWRLAGGLAGLLVLLVGYYFALFVALSRGWYRPAVAWVNVLLESSIPLLFLAMDSWAKGPLYGLNAPPLVIWGALIMFSVLRAEPGLCLAAGAVAAGEYLFYYAVFLHPQLPPDMPVTVTPQFIAIRAALLFSSGLGGAVLARHLVNKAQQALHAVRAVDLLSKYFLHEKLGEGGMAEVFRATYSPEGGFEKEVAVKRVLPAYSDDPDFTELFKREAQICSILNHPNIVQVSDIGKFDGRYVLAMEFVNGLSLEKLLKNRRSPLPLSAVAYLGVELANALDYLHRRVDPRGVELKLVHRDVNPPNVLLSRIGEVKLGDFGVARAANRAEQAGVVVGKLTYLSPEQSRCESLDGRSDLFCLGLTLHEALTGYRVLRGTNPKTLLKAVTEPVSPPSMQRPDVPAELDRIILDLVQQDRERRPVSGREVRARLSALEGPVAPFPNGQAALVRAVEEVLAQDVGEDEAHTAVAPEPASVTMPSSPGL